MKHFKQKIKFNIEQKSYRDANKADWDSFLKFKETKKKDRKPFAIWRSVGLLSGTIALIGIVYFGSSQLTDSNFAPLTGLTVPEQVLTKQSPEIVEARRTSEKIIGSEQLGIKSKPAENIDSKPIPQILKLNETVPVVDGVGVGVGVINNDHPSKSIPSDHKSEKLIIPVGFDANVGSRKHMDYNSALSESPLANNLSLLRLLSLQLDFSDELNKIEFAKRPGFEIAKHQPTKLEMGILLSASLLNYKGLENSFGLQSGISLKYLIAEKVKLRTYISLSRLHYMTSSFIPEIGLRKIDTPVTMQDIKTIQANTDLFNIGLGVQYTILKRNDLAVHISPFAVLEKTLQRDIQYGFDGEQEGENDDGDEIEISDQQLEGIGISAQLRLGASYSIGDRGTIGFEGSYQDQLNQNFSRPSQIGLHVNFHYKLRKIQ